MSEPGGQAVEIVTGAGRGIGAAIAARFRDDGAFVYAVDADGDALGWTGRDSGATTGRVVPAVVDVADQGAVRGLVARVVEEHGRIDVLVNNAGIVRAGMIHKLALSDWEAVLRVNLTAQFITINAVAPSMIEARAGAIVNVSSIAGLRGSIGQPNYAAAKAGVIGLTKAAAAELARYGIRVNAVAPGTVETDMTRTIMETPKLRAQYIDTIPMGRAAQPSEVADAVAYLVSDQSSYVTGHVLTLSGGAYF